MYFKACVFFSGEYVPWYYYCCCSSFELIPQFTVVVFELHLLAARLFYDEIKSTIMVVFTGIHSAIDCLLSCHHLTNSCKFQQENSLHLISVKSLQEPVPYVCSVRAFWLNIIDIPKVSE